MNDEISHVSQWHELQTRAHNFNLAAGFNAEGFMLWRGRLGIELIGTYPTLADLRAGISDWVAEQRLKGVRI